MLMLQYRKKDSLKQQQEKGKGKLLSHVRLFATPWTVTYQAPLSMGLSRQEYWSGECRELARDLPLVTKVMRKEARHTQRRDRASGVSPDILEHLPPKNQSLPTLLLCALTSDFTGGCPHHLALSVKELTYSSN